MGNLLLGPGSLFANRFEIQHAASSGGMGTVYRATDRYSGGLVALKLLHSGGGGNEAERFAREAQLLSELRHPGIVAYVAHGQTAEGQRFLAMEWLQGQDLGERLLRGPLSLRDCVRLLDQVADGLSVAHRRGVIHRDLKPSNLFLVEGSIEQVKMLDFGIARRIATSQAMTRTGLVVGTPEYMAPEQARGARNLTPAADLFSLGCVLYECLTGRPPFVADHVAAVLAQILFAAPIPVSQLRPGVPAPVAALIDKLLVKDPEKRLANTVRLRRELASLGDLTERVPEPTIEEVRPAEGLFAKKEQHLLSVVLASPGLEPAAGGKPLQRTTALLSSSEKESLLQMLAVMGTAAVWLANGTLLTTMPAAGTAPDHAIRAARAALLIRDRWPAAQIAIATGRGMLHGRTAVGEVVDVATRAVSTSLASSSGDGTAEIWLDELSAKLLEGRFAQKPHMGGILLLGEEASDDVTRPLLGKPTPCVGRDAELQILQEQITVCIEESVARMVLVTGAPGAGKSRLRHEFLCRLEKGPESITVLMGRGDIMNAGAPYEIISRALRGLCGLKGDEAPDTQRERLAARLARHLPPAMLERVTLFLGELCHIPFSAADNPLLKAAHQDPKIMGDQVSRALLDWLAAECAAAPVLLVLDDLQWGDELTMSALREMLRELADAPLCIVGFAREEVHEIIFALGHKNEMFHLRLKGLSRKACERLLHAVLGKNVATGLFAQAIEQSGGNALFLEELIRSFAAGKSTAPSATLVAMLQARVGSLEAGARRAVRAAAVYGETFWRGGLLSLLGPVPETGAITTWLEVLQQEEICEKCSESRLPDEDEYRFRHAMIRDAVYDLLSQEDRKLGHQLAGRYLEQAGERDAMILAEHAQRAGESARAAALYARAAEQSLERHDLKGAVIRVERGINAGAQPETLALLQAIHFRVAFFSGNFTTPLEPALRAIDVLAQGSRWWCSVVGYLLVASVHQGALATFNSLVQRMLAVVPSPDALIEYVDATSWLVATFSFLGLREPAGAFWGLTLKAAAPLMESDANIKGMAQNAHAWYLRNLEPAPYQAMLAAREGARACEVAGNWKQLLAMRLCLGMTLAEVGDSAAGEKQLRDALKLPICEEAELYKGNLQAYLALLLVRREEKRDLDEVCALAQQVLEAKMSPIYAGVAKTALAHAALLRGQADHAVEQARQAADLTQPMPPSQLDAQGILIRAFMQAGRIEEAYTLAQKVWQTLDQLSGLGYGEVPLRLAVAEARHAHGDVSGARHAIEEAYRRLHKRAESIADPQWRHRFTTKVPANARVLDLAAAWGAAQYVHESLHDLSAADPNAHLPT